MTQQEAIHQALKARGWQDHPRPKTRKYRVMAGGPNIQVENVPVVLLSRLGRNLYLGKAGALRVGATLSGARPVNEELRRALIEEGEKL